jgi:hypothetical protein
VEAMILTMPTKLNTTVDAKHVFFIFPKLWMITTGTKELAMQKSTKPFYFLYVIFVSYLSTNNSETTKFKELYKS